MEEKSLDGTRGGPGVGGLGEVFSFFFLPFFFSILATRGRRNVDREAEPIWRILHAEIRASHVSAA